MLSNTLNRHNKVNGPHRHWLVGAMMTLAVLAGCQTTEAPQLRRAAQPVPIPAIKTTPPQAAAPRPIPPAAPAVLVAAVNNLVRGFDGKVGIAVVSIDKGWQAAANGDLALPQQSVSKLWVAMTVLDAIDQGRVRLDDPVKVTREDLTLFHQPIAAMVRGEGYQASVAELLQRSLTQSDNTANDRLLRFVGGPAVVSDFIRRRGLGTIKFGPGERLLQSQTAGLAWRSEFATGNGFVRARAQLPLDTRQKAYQAYVADPPDGAAPIAIAGALARLKRGALLSATSTRYLIETMEAARTGKQRLAGAVPPGWRFGHKTGTGQDLAGRTAGYNDVGILTAPDGRSYALAVMIGDTPRPIAERQALMHAVVASVIATSS